MSGDISEAATELDLERLAGWMAEQGATVSPPLTAKRIGLGQSNLTYELTDADAQRWVLRRPPLGTLLQSAHDVAREHRILAGLSTTAVPLAPVVGLLEDQVPHLVTGFVDGVVLDRVERGELLSAEAKSQIGPSISRTLATIHGVDLDAVGLTDLASHAPYAERQLRRWTRQLEGSKTRETPVLDEVAALLQANIPAHTENSLVHGDLHLSNVIADPQTGAVRAALDWELSTIGAPLADLGTLLAYWPEPDEDRHVPLLGTSLPGFARRADLIETYASASGRDVSAVGFWHVLGLWKLAVIIEGIRRRVLDEPRNAAESGPPEAAMIDSLGTEARERAAAYGLSASHPG